MHMEQVYNNENVEKNIVVLEWGYYEIGWPR